MHQEQPEGVHHFMTMKPTDASRKAFSGGEDGRTQIEIIRQGRVLDARQKTNAIND